MVAQSDAFGLFTDIVVIAQILLIAFFIHTVDHPGQKFAESVGGYLMQDPESSFLQERSRMGEGIEDEREVIQAEGLFVIIAFQQVIVMGLLHGQDHRVVGYEGEVQLPVRLADPFGLLKAFEPVLAAVQMVKRPKKQDGVEGSIAINAQVKCIPLSQTDPVFGSQTAPEGGDI